MIKGKSASSQENIMFFTTSTDALSFIFDKIGVDKTGF